MVCRGDARAPPSISYIEVTLEADQNMLWIAEVSSCYTFVKQRERHTSRRVF